MKRFPLVILTIITLLKYIFRLTLVNGGISQVVSLVVSGNYIYWADKEQQLIERANKRNGEDKLIVMSRVYNLSDLLAVLTPTPQVNE